MIHNIQNNITEYIKSHYTISLIPNTHNGTLITDAEEGDIILKEHTVESAVCSSKEYVSFLLHHWIEFWLNWRLTYTLFVQFFSSYSMNFGGIVYQQLSLFTLDWSSAADVTQGFGGRQYDAGVPVLLLPFGLMPGKGSWQQWFLNQRNSSLTVGNIWERYRKPLGVMVTYSISGFQRGW